MGSDRETIREKFEELHEKPPKTEWDKERQEYHALEGAPNRIVNEAFVYTRILDGFLSGVRCKENGYIDR